MRSFQFFCAQQFLVPKSMYSMGIYIEFYRAQYHGVIEPYPFICNTIRSLLNVTRDHSQLIPLSDTLLNLGGTTGVGYRFYIGMYFKLFLPI